MRKLFIVFISLLVLKAQAQDKFALGIKVGQNFSSVNNVNAMAEKAIYILSDDAILKTFKVNAKKRAMVFHIDKIVPQYEHYYEEVIKNSVAL